MSDTLYAIPIYDDWTVKQLEQYERKSRDLQFDCLEDHEMDFWWTVANLLAARMRED